MVLLAFHDGDACGVKLLNIPTECARERIPIYSDSIRVLLQAISGGGDNASIEPNLADTLLRDSRRVDLDGHNGGLFDSGADEVTRYAREFLDR